MKFCKTACALSIALSFSTINASELNYDSEELERANSVTETGVFNIDGKKAYLIRLDSQSITPNGTSSLQIPPRRLKGDSTIRPPSPAGIAAIAHLKNKHNIKAVLTISYIDLVATAFLNDEELKSLQSDDKVIDIFPEMGLSAKNSPGAPRLTGDPQPVRKWTTPYTDSSGPSGDLRSWGKTATGATDSVSVSTPMYLIDAQLPNSPDLDIYVTRLNDAPGKYDSQNAAHSLATAGIMGGIANGNQTEGVNPGTSIIAASIRLGPMQISDAAKGLEDVFLDADEYDRFSVLNMSLNNEDFSSAIRGGVTAVQRWMQIASNRLFIAQSAGNERGSACSWAYDSTNLHDGIMVVGGYDQNGAQAVGYTHAPNKGSNYGPCVEVWAPSKNIAINSLHSSSNFTPFPEYNGTLPFVTTGGTSFASPFVAAIAARAGNNVRPPAREAYIRRGATPTGYADTNNLQILGVKVPSYSATTTYYLPPATISSPNSSVNLNYLSDGYFMNGLWNAMGNSGTVIYNVGANSRLDSVRVTPFRSAPGTATYNFSTSVDGVNWTSAGPTVHSPQAESFAPISASLNGTNARWVKVDISSTGSWVALLEMEVYGSY